MEDPATGARPLNRVGDGPYSIEWTPAASGAVALAAGASAGVAEHSRVVLITVVPDAAPRVRIQKPGRDLAFTTPNQIVDVAIEADDPEGLRDLELRYTRMSGSGESFEFAEGQVPVRDHPVQRDPVDGDDELVAGRHRPRGRRLAGLSRDGAGQQPVGGLGAVGVLHHRRRQAPGVRGRRLRGAGRGPPLRGQPADGDHEDRAAAGRARRAHRRRLGRADALPRDRAAHGAVRGGVPQRRRGRGRGRGGRAFRRTAGRAPRERRPGRDAARHQRDVARRGPPERRRHGRSAGLRARGAEGPAARVRPAALLPAHDARARPHRRLPPAERRSERGAVLHASVRPGRARRRGDRARADGRPRVACR